MFDQGFGAEDIEILDRTRGFDGYFKVDVYRFRHRLFAGGWSGPVQREVFERGHAVALVPYDPVRERVLLVRQVRLPAHVAGMKSWQIEAVAGIVDAGETAEAVAYREAEEEAGLTVTQLWPLYTFMTSAGASSETVKLFLARADLDAAGGLHGLDEEHEDIEATVLSVGEACRLIEAGEIQNTPAMLALQWLQLNHARVRAAWGA